VTRAARRGLRHRGRAALAGCGGRRAAAGIDWWAGSTDAAAVPARAGGGDGADAGRRAALRVEWQGEHARLGDDDWWVRRRSGELPAELLADRPVEERERATWDVTWAVRLAGGAPVPLLSAAVDGLYLRAPQPTDEPISVRALLSASVSLDTARRRAVEGAHDVRAGAGGRGVRRHAGGGAADPALLDLVPTGLPTGSVDAVLRDALADRLAAAPLFASAGDPDLRLRAAEAAVVDAGAASDPVTALLAPHVPQLVPAAYGTRHGVLAALGVRRLATSDVVDLLSSVDQPPSWWAGLYAAVAGATDRDALRALPVPLADGGWLPGRAGCCSPVPSTCLR
jgi:hypothetical protein